MKRSEILQILARRLSNRDVEDIQEAAILEMKFVQETVLEKLPVQPWFLQTEIILPLAQADKFVELPEDYNSLDTTGGVWIAPAEVDSSPSCIQKEVNFIDSTATILGLILIFGESIIDRDLSIYIDLDEFPDAPLPPPCAQPE